MADHAPLPCFFGFRLFGHDSETPDMWDCDLVGIESGIAFSPDAMGIFYLVATVDAWDNRDNRDGDFNPCFGCGGVDSFRCAKMITWATVKVAPTNMLCLFFVQIVTKYKLFEE